MVTGKWNKSGAHVKEMNKWMDSVYIMGKSCIVNRAKCTQQHK